MEFKSVQIWLKYVNGLPWLRGCLDASSWLAFLRAGSLGVDSDISLKEVCERIGFAGDHPRKSKVRSQLRRAYEFIKTADAIRSLEDQNVRKFKPKFNADFAAKFAKQVPPITADWLRRHSAIPALPQTPIEFLWGLYTAGERILTFTDPRSRGELWTKDKARCDRLQLKHLEHGHREGVWFLPQPVDGLEHYNPRQARVSRRSEESITAFRFVVLESDCQSTEQWLRIVVQLPLPIVSICTSGGKSVHALARIDAPSKAAWDAIVRDGLLPRLVTLGVDGQVLTAVRLSRLPGCYRDDRIQELLYLNPDADGEPIWKGTYDES